MTFWLSSLGLLMVSLGIRTTLNQAQWSAAFHIDRLRPLLEKTTLTRLIVLYLILTALGTVVDVLIPWDSSLKQLEVQFLKLPSVIIFAICLHQFLFRQKRLLFTVFMILVIVQNLYSYFSEWRLPIEILITASLVQIKEFKTPQLLRQIPLLLITLLFVGIWQSIKGEYRYILSSGQENQQITISRNEALQAALQLATTSYQEGAFADSSTVQATYQRTGYLEFFAATIEKVPTEISFERGSLTSSNLEYALIPRILNPNKSNKNDRAKVEKYTGIYFGGAGSRASFSLGHYCEAYIDWGSWGMMLHLFLYGCIGGWVANQFTRRTIVRDTLFGAGTLFTVLSFWGTYQKDMITVTGSLFWGGLAFLILFPPLLRNIPLSPRP